MLSNRDGLQLYLAKLKLSNTVLKQYDWHNWQLFLSFTDSVPWFVFWHEKRLTSPR
jgi:hypothetical protein